MRARGFVGGRTRYGRKSRVLRVVDEFTREAPAIRVGRKPASADAIDTLADPFVLRGVPALIRSDQGPGFAAGAVEGWIAGAAAAAARIERGSPWENGYVEGFNARLRDEPLGGEVFHTVAEARVPIERRRQHHNVQRPHSALGYRPPAPEVMRFGPPGRAPSVEEARPSSPR